MGTARVEGMPVKVQIGKQDLTWSVGINGLLSDDSGVSILSFGFPGNTFTGYRKGFGADSQLQFGPFGLQAEWIYMDYQTAADAQPDFYSTGYFLTATYDILPKKLQAVARWEQVETEDDVGGKAIGSLVVGLAVTKL